MGEHERGVNQRISSVVVQIRGCIEAVSLEGGRNDGVPLTWSLRTETQNKTEQKNKATFQYTFVYNSTTECIHPSIYVDIYIYK